MNEQTTIVPTDKDKREFEMSLRIRSSKSERPNTISPLGWLWGILKTIFGFFVGPAQ